MAKTLLLFGFTLGESKWVTAKFPSLRTIDITDYSPVVIQHLYEATSAPVIAVKSVPQITMTETFIRQSATVGLLERTYPILRAESAEKVCRMLRETEGEKGAPLVDKEPDEVSQLRQDQERENVMRQKEQEQELLSAQERELETKSQNRLSQLDNKAEK